MQNARLVQIFHEVGLHKRDCCRIALALAVALALLLTVVSGRQQAYAQAVSLPNTAMNAVVNVDGSLQVNERRLVGYDQGGFSLAWPLESPSDNAVLRVSGVRIAPADSQGNQMADWMDLPNTHFVLQWRTQGGPAENSFAIDSPKDTVFVFFGGNDAAQQNDSDNAKGEAAAGVDGGSVEASEVVAHENASEERGQGEESAPADAESVGSSEDATSSGAESADASQDEADGASEDSAKVPSEEAQVNAPQYVLVELTYVWENGAVAFKDVGEVYWKYVSDAWAFASQDVTMTLALPLPQGVTAVANGNVHAWGHGPSNGTFAVLEDGTISYYDSSVVAGQFAEARVLFPVGWIHGVSDEVKLQTQEVSRLDSALSQEEGWSDPDAMWRVRELNRIVVSAIACLLALLASVAAYLAFGRTHTPDFTERYLRTVPSDGLHPAVAGRLWRWNHNNRADVVSTVLRLRNVGAVEVTKVTEGELASDDSDCIDWRITRIDDDEACPGNVLDAQVMHLLFPVMAQGSKSVLVSELCQFGAHHAKDYVDATDEFRWSLTNEVLDLGYFDMRSKRVQLVVLVASLLVFAVGVGWSVAAGRIFPAVFAVPSALAMFALGNYLFRRTVEGANLVARCQALRNWLVEFPKAGETLDDSQVDWQLLIPYAYQFGVADAVAANAMDSAYEQEAADIALFARALQHALDASMHDARKILSKERSTYGGERATKETRPRRRMLPGVRDVNDNIDF